MLNSEQRNDVHPVDHHRGAGRPATALLNRKRITDAAMRLIRSKGPDGLTMAGLASALGVSAAALYNHADSKNMILRWVEDRLMQMIDVSAFGEIDWRSATIVWARNYWRVMRDNNQFVEAIAKTPIGGAPQTIAMYEAVAAGLLAGGWPLERIVPAIIAIESFIYGSAFDAQAPESLLDPGELSADAPVFSRAVGHYRSADYNVAAEHTFEDGLAALLTGLALSAGVRG
ncbi:TetR/AcrR family transcriptional regulator [Subtercola vilae]|uniref:TetR/AcrR family transcriptional regulator n=1 Tax=Subtercola vilae TaxID=2056433 RepID=A0A4T2C6W5_9MICO|nr:TetR/AcrR family transcriptional regulator [Subtercola vilae]